MNDESNIIYSILAVLVIILLTVTAIIPIIEDSQKEIKSTGQNTGMEYSVSNATGNAIEIVYADDKITVNDYEVPSDYDFRIIAISDSFMIESYSGGNMILVLPTGLVIGLTTITIDGGTMTYSGETTGTVSVTGNVLYAAPKGDYGMFIYGSEFLANSDTVFYSYASDTLTNSNLDPSSIFLAGVFKGTYNNVTPTFTFSESEITSVSVQYESTDNEDLTYTVDVGTGVLTATTALGDYTVPAFRPIIAPLEYEYISSSDSGLIQLLTIIPLILFMVPVMMIVSIYRRD